MSVEDNDVEVKQIEYMRYMGGRKFVLAMVAILIVSLLRAFDMLNDQSYAFIIVSTIAAYIGGNVYEAVKTGSKESS